jgi:hypothetical protein
MENKLNKKFKIQRLVNENIIKRKITDTSTTLLSKHDNEIKNYLKKYKKNILFYMSEDNNLNLLDEEFRKSLDPTNNFDNFIKYLIKIKFNVVSQRKKCNDFLKNMNLIKNNLKFPAILKENSINKEIISNIFNNDDFSLNIESNQIKIMNKMLKAEYFDDKKKEDSINYLISNISYYNNINILAPTIGNVYLSNNLSTSLSHMILNICNGENDISSFIPLHVQNIKDDISALVIKKDGENIDYKKKVLSSILGNIDISYDSIMKDKNKIKKNYIIPYERKDSNSEGSDSKYKFEYEKYITLTSSKEVIQKNLELVSQVLEYIETNPKNINKANVKEILGLYVYFIITLFYDIYNAYLLKINSLLYELSEDVRYSNDNIDLGLAYINKSMESLKMFKKILLNNFYDFFIPSKLTKAYGIKLDEHGYVVCGSKLAIDYESLIKSYPFKHFKSSEIKLEINRDSLLAINNFIVGKKRNGDLYNPRELLYIGYYIPNDNKMKDLLAFLKYYINVLNSQFTFSIFICNLLSKVLMNYLPYDLFEHVKKIESLKNNSSNKSKNEIIIHVYKHMVKAFNIIKSSKDKKYNKEKIKDIKEKEEVILLSNYYYNYSTIIYELINENQSMDINVKKYLLTQMKRVFDKIEGKLRK